VLLGDILKTVRVLCGDGVEEISKRQEPRFPEFRDKEDRRKGLIMEWNRQ